MVLWVYMGQTLVAFQLLVFDVLLNLVEDGGKERISLVLERLVVSPEALYFREVPDVYVLAQEQQLAILADAIS